MSELHRLVKMSEQDLQDTVLPVAKLYRWLAVHFLTAPMRVDKGGRTVWITPFVGDAGFPDLVLVRDRTLFRELKQDGKYPTPEQKAWLDALVASGQDAKVWRPADWVSGLILKELTQ